MRKLFYRFIKNFGYITTRIFFDKLEMVGYDKIPRNYPLLFVPNHQNSFLDAFIAGTIPKFSIHYLTRADVFNKKFLWFIEGMHMIPIYRMRDGASNLSQNEEIFNRCVKLMQEGDDIMIFAEGNHGEEHFLRPFSKGMSRLAFSAQEAIPDKDVYIVPVGINYFNPRRPRRRVIMVFGNPIRVRDFDEEYFKSKPKALNKLKNLTWKRVADCMMIPHKDEYYEFKKAALTRENEKLPFHELKIKLASIKSMPDKKPNLKFFKIAGLFFSLFNFLPLWYISYIIKTRIKDQVFYASIKWGLGSVLIPIWWGFVFTISSIICGWEIGTMLFLFQFLSLFLGQESIKMSSYRD